MRRILFIINPAAGKKKNHLLIPKIKNRMDSTNIPYDIRVSKYKGEISELVNYEQHNDYTDMIAVGGDGTLIELVNGLTNFDIRVGVLPSGTGNDFVKSTKSPIEFDQAMDAIIKGKTKEINMGEVNGVVFLNVVSTGIDGSIIQDTEKIKTLISGSAAYLTATVKNIISYKSKPMKLVLDDKVIEDNFTLVAVGNGNYFGGGMKVTPFAEIEKEYFEVCIVRKINNARLLTLFPKIYSGSHGSVKEVEFFKCKNITITSTDENLKVNADGNTIGELPMTINIKNAKLKLLF